MFSSTYFSVFKLWFTLSASASAVAPLSPILFNSRLWKSNPELGHTVKMYSVRINRSCVHEQSASHVGIYSTR